jgi:hypothetical protein
MSTCEDCRRSTSGDCGMHGSVSINIAAHKPAAYEYFAKCLECEQEHVLRTGERLFAECMQCGCLLVWYPKSRVCDGEATP